MVDTTQAIVYRTFDLTKITEGTFATLDAVANLSSQLTTMGVEYDKDWKLADIFYNNEGQQCITVEFKDDKIAMLVKLKGVRDTLGKVV